MCLLVYPKSENQVQVLTSLLKEMNIDYDKSEEISYNISKEYESILLDRIKELENNPQIAIPHEEVRNKIKEKYGI